MCDQCQPTTPREELEDCLIALDEAHRGSSHYQRLRARVRSLCAVLPLEDIRVARANTLNGTSTLLQRQARLHSHPTGGSHVRS